LRSAFDALVEAGTEPKSLEGLVEAAGAGEEPKKSRPRRDSAGFDCFAATGAAFGGG